MSDTEISVRADPDALLQAIAKKKSKKRGGRLYLFIGMAPGVGKTFAMLQAARDAKKNEIDVVVGVAETHGRKETEALLEGLETIPKKMIEHRGIIFYELDIDALLERKPAIALVDELAHTNVPGSRHEKRWQDVFELLDAGIDVYSTLNVQHLESRKDAVEEIAKIMVSETVPDSVLDRAFQIQLIDLSVPNLLRRLKEGKVYLGEKAELAAANFFKEEKLTALREISLRLAAEKVDAELQTFATEREAGTSWSAVDRLMLGIGYGRQSEKMIRATRKMAYNLDAPWMAVHVITNEMASDAERSALKKHLDLARKLGAEIITVADISVVDALLRIAKQRDVTQIVVGRSSKNWFRDRFGRGTIFDQLVKKSAIDICIIGSNGRRSSKAGAGIFSFRIESTLMSYAKAVIFAIGLTVINALLVNFIGYRSVGFLFLLGILIFGLIVSIGPVLLSAILTMISWNYFFIPPTGAFHISEPEDLFLCISYLVAALATGILTRRNKYQQDILIEREKRSQILNKILVDTVTETNPKTMISSVVSEITVCLGGDADVALLRKDRSLAPFIEHRLSVSNINREMAVAKWAVDNNKVAGRFTETLSSAEAIYIPLRGLVDMVGVLAYQGKKSKSLSIEDMDFLYTVGRQLAVSIERENFRRKALESERLLESEKVHQTLLQLLVSEIRATSITQANEKLAFTIDNFLTISRMTVGIFPLKKEPCDLRQILDAAIGKTRFALGARRMIIHAEERLRELNLERELFVQAIANVLLNSAEHTLPESEITVEIGHSEEEARMVISDNGTGVIDGDLGRIFDKFYRAPGSKSRGHGLGLAIAKRVVKAHEGKISASNRDGGGLVINISLPLYTKNNQTSTLDTLSPSPWVK